MIWRGLAILAAVVIAAVPWGLQGETTFILPFVTLLLVFLFSVHPSWAIPGWLVFAAGLATDVLTAGPLGYWAFIYTFSHAMARHFACKAPAESMSGLWLRYSVTASLAGATSWGLATVYYLRIIDWWPIALGTMVSILLCPFVAWLMRRSLTLGRYHTLAAAR
jgi:rod shape-determining protein MreD